jgi:ABC-type branched-subunit amino acid transport system substrate-binding protein
MRSKLVVAAATAITALVLAACSSSGGSSGSSSSGSHSAGTEGSGTIHLGIMTAITSPSGLTTFQDAVAGAQAAVYAINQAGGVNGKKLQLDVCDTQTDPNQELTCARKVGSDDVACIYCSTHSTTPVSYLNDKKFPDIGGFHPGATAEQNSAPNQFHLVNTFNSDPTFQPLQVAAIAKGYQADSVSLGVTDLSSALAIQVEGSDLTKLLDSVGIKFLSTVRFPLSATDFTPYLSTLKQSGAKALETITSEKGGLQLAKAADALGYTGPLVMLADVLKPVDLVSLKGTNAVVTQSSPVPPLSDTQVAGIAHFQSDVKAASASGIKNLGAADVDSYTLEAWADVQIAAKAAGMISGDVTASSMFTELSTLSSPIDLGGVIPGGWDPKNLSKFNYLEVAKDGAWSLIKSGPVCTAVAGCGSTKFGDVAAG